MRNKAFIFGLFCCFLLFSCKTDRQEKVWDFEQIKESGKLNVITLSSSYSYFIYKEEPMGYDYDLAKDFADYHNLELNIIVAENATRLIQMLQNGEGDIIAYPIVIQNSLKDSLVYCGPQQVSHQVLVQRSNSADTLLTDVTELIGKDIYVKHNTKYYQRLVNLNAELGGGIDIKDIVKDTVTTEDLIEMVSDGKIKYTVSDDYVAKLNRTYYNNINISLALSFDQRSSWLVRKNTPELAKALEEWGETIDKTPVYKAITKKYFELSKMPFDGEYIVPDSLPKGSISGYDPLFRKYAENSDFDWFLLAAMAYQESRFKPNLTSWAGATGLMGLMPRTAVSLGISVEDRTNPELSIMASVKLLERLDKMFVKSVPDKDERINFILAAYNGGHGHIYDAQALARKYGGDPSTWDSVHKFLELKSNPDYYNDPVVKNGYLRGTETLNYVKQVAKNRERFRQRHMSVHHHKSK
ncbi:lytic transglycosylase F [Dysgonomonas sp. 216]|uniref:transglycosylase SLT domain-containing protein n=1 Tax=Dysgonomonas sp. 216 TaxID=2302934 RepID=UPI0013D143CF|nr:transporter substrate-binding domain-containing protein [Dysgonomonas sp. 216]NDW18967.1 lytic transglycosylase F [Dysgonomonas sp. 216]